MSDATPEVVLREREPWEPADELSSDQHVALRTDRPVSSVVGELVVVSTSDSRRSGISKPRVG